MNDFGTLRDALKKLDFFETERNFRCKNLTAEIAGSWINDILKMIDNDESLRTALFTNTNIQCMALKATYEKRNEKRERPNTPFEIDFMFRLLDFARDADALDSVGAAYLNAGGGKKLTRAGNNKDGKKITSIHANKAYISNLSQEEAATKIGCTAKTLRERLKTNSHWKKCIPPDEKHGRRRLKILSSALPGLRKEFGTKKDAEMIR